MDISLSTAPYICAELGLRLRAHRLAQMMSQSDLAARAGVSTGTIKNIERQGQASMESIIRVAQALNLSDDLQGLFAIKAISIADLERADAATRRKRAPRRAAVSTGKAG